MKSAKAAGSKLNVQGLLIILVELICTEVIFLDFVTDIVHKLLHGLFQYFAKKSENFINQSRF